jgi:hypothetical protein
MEQKKTPAKATKKPVKKTTKKVEKPARILKGAFSQEKFDKILNTLSFSAFSLVNVCKSNDLDPKFFYLWLEGNEERIQQYARAKELQAEFLAEQIIEIADDSTGDKKTIMKEGVLIEIEDKEFSSRSKLKVDARKWIASKLKPKKYGDKIEVDQKTEVSGEINHVITGMIICDEEEENK